MMGLGCCLVCCLLKLSFFGVFFYGVVVEILITRSWLIGLLGGAGRVYVPWGARAGKSEIARVRGRFTVVAASLVQAASIIYGRRT